MLDLVKETVEELMAAHAPPKSAEAIAQEEQSGAEDRIKLAQASGATPSVALLFSQTEAQVFHLPVSLCSVLRSVKYFTWCLMWQFRLILRSPCVLCSIV